MQAPVWFQTVTGYPRLAQDLDFALYSPSKRVPDVPLAKQKTILDCWTWAARQLVQRKRISISDCVDHYAWYIKTVQSLSEAYTVVAPDFDWLPSQSQLQLKRSWESAKISTNLLVVPGTFCADFFTESVTGYALTPDQAGPVHPKWTHCFSGKHQPVVGTEFWSYDSHMPRDS